MKVVLVFIAAGVVGFLVAFSFTAKDEIAAEVVSRTNADVSHQCLRQMKSIAPDPARATDICACMEAEFAANGYELMDAFGSDRAAMQDITRSCVSLYM